MCVCVCVCARACVRARVTARACARHTGARARSLLARLCAACVLGLVPPSRPCAEQELVFSLNNACVLVLVLVHARGCAWHLRAGVAENGERGD
jgi:hypothetical protein